MNIKLKTPPAVEPISLTEAKLHLRVDHSAEDAYIGSLIVAARQFSENYQRRAYVQQVYEIAFDKLEKIIKLPRPPLIAVDEVKVYYKDGTDEDLTGFAYDNRKEPGLVLVEEIATKELRESSGVVITFKAGYGTTAASVPQAIKQAMMMLIGLWYENREAIAIGNVAGVKIPYSVEALLSQERYW